MVRWASGRTKVQLKLAVQRAHMLQAKRESLAKKARRDIADLVVRGKVETARVKTESLIMDDVHIELLELLELYCETLYARFALLEMPGTEPPEAIREPLLAILHAAHRTELAELHTLQEMLAARYGPELAKDALENVDGCVSPRVTRKLAFHMPPPELVDAYMDEICKAYDVPLPGAHEDAGAADTAGASGEAAGDAAPTADDAAGDGKAGAPSGKAGASSGAGAPSESGTARTAPSAAPGAAAGAPFNAPSDWDALMSRFAALKRPK
ncbi:Vacuolar protein sorting-associated protein ist1 [Malassezia furfur]|uniref:Vacuolar protein sorting-associated protein ist1 n=1 Tax=Malassezia furfur TaxID=55194 RepID=A0ABY8EUE9_MALFU|nr:Vacuolar protein sorting-associated protein ist1 [Malassezia furfur]